MSGVESARTRKRNGSSRGQRRRRSCCWIIRVFVFLCDDGEQKSEVAVVAVSDCDWRRWRKKKVEEEALVVEDNCNLTKDDDDDERVCRVAWLRRSPSVLTDVQSRWNASVRDRERGSEKENV
mmetsp:Transcript_2098/g.4672  ORF Transcript_2098/g.4672 Transcript_2098/m.4672 type:complete len:123 (+) Transcript_2098:670-1038(+)